jgi:hypothetical protein
MSKRKDRKNVEDLFARVAEIAMDEDATISDEALRASADLVGVLGPEGKRELVRMKKFRFQLLHEWMVQHVAPCRVADIGGGKGLMAYLLTLSGWQATVIDPVHQPLPTKYKDLATNRQVRIDPSATVPRLDQPFAPEMARDFDLLIAMHAHGCNIMLIDAAAEYGRQVILLPCCIIDEPLVPPAGVHWLQCVADYAKGRGFSVEPFRLNFKGQNIGLYLTPAA